MASKSSKAVSVSLDDLNVTMQDVLAIAVSDAENQLNETIKSYTAEANSLETQADALETKVRVDNEAEVLALVQGKVDDIRPYFAEFDGSVSVSLSTTNYRGQHASHATVRFAFGHSYIEHQHSLPYSVERVAEISRAGELRTAATHARTVVVEARRKKADLGSIERQARAKLARRSLESREGGAELLAVLTGDIKNSLDALPGS